MADEKVINRKHDSTSKVDHNNKTVLQCYNITRVKDTISGEPEGPNKVKQEKYL